MNIILHTAGNGYWSKAVKDILVTGMEIAYVDDETDFGELRVKFDTTTWDVYADGLIYTDKQFIKELREYLDELGYAGDVSYSEQGMQGDDYVSLDVDGEFLASWQAINNDGVVEALQKETARLLY